MGSPKPQTVGGGSAAPVANSWNQFLQGQLYQQPGTQSVPQTAAGAQQQQGGNIPPWAQTFGNALSGGQMAQGQQQGQGAPGPFQQLMQSMMNPNIGNMIQSNPFLQGAQGYNPMAQLPNAPNFGYPGMQGQGGGGFLQNINPNGGSFPGGQVPQGTGGFNMWGGNPQGGNPLAQPNIPNIAGGYNPAQAATTDPLSFINSLGGGQGGLGLLQQFGIDPKALIGGGITPGTGVGGGPVNFQGGQLKDYTTDPSFQAIQDIAKRQQAQDVANLRARYGMGGNTQSSGASLAEAQYNAEANPRLIASLGGLGREIQGLDLEQQKINNAARSAMGAGSGAASAAMSEAQSRNLGNILQFIQGIQGQNVGAGAGLMGQNLSNQQSASNLNANNQLQAMGMDANNIMNLFGQNSQNALNLFGQQSANALNNQGQANNWMQTLFGGGLNLAGMGQQGQQNLMQQLFNSFNQANQLGTPQAQTVQNPSQASQIMGMAASFAPMLFGMPPMPGLMGGGSGMSAPQIQPYANTPYVPNFGIGRRP